MEKKEFKFYIENEDNDPIFPETWYYKYIINKESFDAIINDDLETFRKENNLKLKCSLLDLLLAYHDCYNKYIWYHCDGGYYEYHHYRNRGEIMRDDIQIQNILKENMYKIVNFILKYDIVEDKTFGTEVSNNFKIEESINYILTPRANREYRYDNGNGRNFESLKPYIDLVSACKINAFNIVKYFVDKGLDPNVVPERWYWQYQQNPTPLFYAIKNENFEMVKYLVENGAYLHIPDFLYDDSIDCESYDIEDEYLLDYEILQECKNFEIIHYLIEKDMISKGLDIFEKYITFKSKERSYSLREELIAKYYSPENIEKWSDVYGKDFDEVQDLM